MKCQWMLDPQPRRPRLEAYGFSFLSLPAASEFNGHRKL